MTKKQTMTKMQKAIYDFIATTVAEQGYPPSVREIGEAVGLKSPSTVYFHLTHMEELGIIQKGAGKGRAIRLVDQPAPRAAEAAEEEVTVPAGKVPVVGNVAAGTPILAQECIEEYIPFDTNGKDGEYFALRVRGESMINAGILPGDLVVVHQQKEAHNGEIVVALLEDEATVKRLNRKNGEVWLMPENPDYQPIDGRYATILGKVSAVLRTYS